MGLALLMVLKGKTSATALVVLTVASSCPSSSSESSASDTSAGKEDRMDMDDLLKLAAVVRMGRLEAESMATVMEYWL